MSKREAIKTDNLFILFLVVRDMGTNCLVPHGFVWSFLSQCFLQISYSVVFFWKELLIPLITPQIGMFQTHSPNHLPILEPCFPAMRISTPPSPHSYSSHSPVLRAKSHG